jgi:hypothetical protein
MPNPLDSEVQTEKAKYPVGLRVLGQHELLHTCESRDSGVLLEFDGGMPNLFADGLVS